MPPNHLSELNQINHESRWDKNQAFEFDCLNKIVKCVLALFIDFD